MTSAPPWSSHAFMNAEEEGLEEEDRPRVEVIVGALGGLGLHTRAGGALKLLTCRGDVHKRCLGGRLLSSDDSWDSVPSSCTPFSSTTFRLCKGGERELARHDFQWLLGSGASALAVLVITLPSTIKECTRGSATKSFRLLRC